MLQQAASCCSAQQRGAHRKRRVATRCNSVASMPRVGRAAGECVAGVGGWGGGHWLCALRFRSLPKAITSCASGDVCAWLRAWVHACACARVIEFQCVRGILLATHCRPMRHDTSRARACVLCVGCGLKRLKPTKLVCLKGTPAWRRHRRHCHCHHRSPAPQVGRATECV